MTSEAIEDAKRALAECRFEDAISILEENLAEDETDPDTLVLLGIAYVQAENAEKAVDVLKTADELLEEHCVVSLFLGRALEALGQLDEAEIHLRRAIRLDPGEPEAWKDVGRILLAQKRYAELIETAREAVSRFSSNVYLRSLYAIGLYRLGDYTGACRQWYEVYKRRPESLLALSNFAYMLLKQGRLTKVKTYIEQATKIGPKDSRTLFLQGELNLQKRNFRKAKAFFEQALDKQPKNLTPLSRLAIVAHHEGKPDMRDDLITEIREIGRDNPHSWKALAYIYEQLGQIEKLVDYLLHFVSQNHCSAAPWVKLAAAYEKLGSVDEAEHAWTMSFKLRRYVKIHCRHCGTYLRLPYEKEEGFDIHRDRNCLECNSVIPMPDALADI